MIILVTAPATLASAQEWVEVASVEDIKALSTETDSIRVLFRRSSGDGQLLETLADHHPQLSRLALICSGVSRVGSLASLSKFEQLSHLEIRDRVSNLCYSDPRTGTRQLDVVGSLISLRTLVLDIY